MKITRSRGRPPHTPSLIDRRVVELLASKGVPQAQICSVLGISEKTLRRRYPEQLHRGASKLESALVMHLYRIACGMDRTAMRAIEFILKARFGWSEFAPPRR
jgi:DNA-binding Lrp family transcriptional regulator